MKYTEARLEQAVIKLLEDQQYTHIIGDAIERKPDGVLIKSDLKHFLEARYKHENITDSIITHIEQKTWVLNQQLAEEYGLENPIESVIKKIGPGTSAASLNINLSVDDNNNPVSAT